MNRGRETRESLVADGRTRRRNNNNNNKKRVSSLPRTRRARGAIPMTYRENVRVPCICAFYARTRGARACVRVYHHLPCPLEWKRCIFIEVWDTHTHKRIIRIRVHRGSRISRGRSFNPTRRHRSRCSRADRDDVPGSHAFVFCVLCASSRESAVPRESPSLAICRTSVQRARSSKALCICNNNNNKG